MQVYNGSAGITAKIIMLYFLYLPELCEFQKHPNYNGNCENNNRNINKMFFTRLTGHYFNKGLFDSFHASN